MAGDQGSVPVFMSSTGQLVTSHLPHLPVCLPVPLPISLTPACPLSLSPSHQFYLHASWEPPGFCLYPVSLPCLAPCSLSGPLSATFRVTLQYQLLTSTWVLYATPPPRVSLSFSGSLSLFSKSLCPHPTSCAFISAHPTFSEDRSPPSQTVPSFFRLP